ncbi:GNAT family N-acetyltransferase [Paenibacillus paeoniae]|uniref:GNAT family N-acetyltransferase n=1 Tax=Paenibacillus paeoniae TaxID=2292705 RepID=A0A371PGQ3_9BACL|nr:GNAT family N-acetyltransferase [Paenibacillus paeoniae]REK75137.1 GNAT family N-acetyltransferase [Paenibacillus paeoniae]
MISIEEVGYEQKSVLQNLLELYKYDFSEFDSDDDINSNGLYGYMFLDHYWTEDGRYPFFIKVDGKLAGFALIRNMGAAEENNVVYSMAEFFVLKKYRRLKVGQTAAHQLFDQFPGSWKVAQMETNIPAQAFWRKTIDRYTHGNYNEATEDGWEGPIQVFFSASRG